MTPGGPVPHHAVLEVHAVFWLDVGPSVAQGEIARRLGAFADARGGWVQATSLGEIPGESHVTLRVPPTALAELRAMLDRQAGGADNVREQTSSTDVTEALADLDARLHAARATESRLLALLDQHTGTLADVLAVEQALGQERAHIEQLETEQRNAQGRVDQATVDVWLEHGPSVVHPSLGRQLAQAGRDGLLAARAVVVGTVLLALEAGPTLLILASLVLGCVWAVRAFRARRRRGN